MRYNELLSVNDILNFLAKQLSLTPFQKGKNIFFLCPFHEDKNPSLSLEVNWKSFKCFACNFSARNIFELWAKHKKGNREITDTEIRQSMVEISKLGYFSLSSWEEKEKNAEKSKGKMVNLFSLIVDIYCHNLVTLPGQKVFDYLRVKRGLSQELINRFLLGSSINRHQLTSLFATTEKKTQFEDLLLTNLIQISNDNRTYDYFSDQQLLVPLKNEEGEIIALAARKINEESSQSKYNYLPSYQSYRKSSLLYNYSLVKQSRVDEVYLVEGFFDVMSLTKIGVENCLALLGTSFSAEQVQLLRKLKKRVILFLDGDRAGREATINIAIILLKEEIDCEIIRGDYPDDPDEICGRMEKEAVISLLRTRQNPYLFILDYWANQWSIKDNPQRIARFIEEVAKLFAKFKDNIHRFLIEKISHLTLWSQEEVETYFSPLFLPTLHLNHYCQQIIQQKEKEIIALCTKQRKFWLITDANDYSFRDKKTCHYFQTIYNYYISSPYHKFFPTKYYELSTDSQEKNISQIFYETKVVKKYLTG